MRIYLNDLREEVAKTVKKVDSSVVIDSHARSPFKQLGFLPLDHEYWLLPKETWQMVLDWSRVDKIKYLPDRIDCDDFARILDGEVRRKLKINGIGLVVDWSGAHAYTVLGIVDDADEVSLVGVEPQNDRMGVVAGGGRMYAAKSGFVLF